MELLKPPEVSIDAVVEDHWATSADGTRIPYHTMRLAGNESTALAPASEPVKSAAAQSTKKSRSMVVDGAIIWTKYLRSWTAE